MFSVAQKAPTAQDIPIAILQFRPTKCLTCLQAPPDGQIMHRVRILKLKRNENEWSIRFRCPRPACGADYSIRLSYTEEEGLKVVTWPDDIVFTYAEGNSTAEETAKEYSLHCGSSVWRAVDAAIKRVEEWIGYCTTFLHKHNPESLDQLLRPQPPVYLANRRFRKPDRARHLALLRELPRWGKACMKALGIEWPYGVLRFLRNISPRFDNVCRCL